MPSVDTLTYYNQSTVVRARHQPARAQSTHSRSIIRMPSSSESVFSPLVANTLTSYNQNTVVRARYKSLMPNRHSRSTVSTPSLEPAIVSLVHMQHAHIL
ncbi:hypothetical protein M408DRAFT_195261 [Serendipita vermifera MAFF 305830]|uniref:Uncharacterized protein n=1 Tax=Serendipita vermifera MAFF 305830 TaxID=933852 RepID=A0A0C3B290_SERVB|nr:hypothetical protein M408DRAFT_195261 [Serendipita vermifera MAFF 305830]